MYIGQGDSGSGGGGGGAQEALVLGTCACTAHTVAPAACGGYREGSEDILGHGVLGERLGRERVREAGWAWSRSTWYGLYKMLGIRLTPRHYVKYDL